MTRLIIKKKTVIKLFEALGFKTAKSWDEARLLKKVKQLPELVEETKIKNPKMKRILEKILAADKVVFKEEEESEESERPSEEEETQEKETKAMSTKPEKKTVKKEKKPTVVKAKVEKDAFGRRLGTQGALIDEHLDKKGKTVEQLAKECKMPTGRISNHVRDLVSKGFLKKGKDGDYALTDKTNKK